MPSDNNDTHRYYASHGGGLDPLDEEDDYFDEPLVPADDDCKCGGHFMLQEGLFTCVACGAKPGE